MEEELGSLDLSARLLAGDQSVARDLYQSFGKLMFAVAFRVLNNRSLAEDATQQAFVQAWNARATVDPSKDLRPWLCVIAQRAAIDIGRRETRRAQEPLDADRPQGELVSHPDYEASWNAWKVREAVSKLPLGEQEVMRLQHFEGCTHTEVGERLGISVGTVKSRSHRAHRRLATALGGLKEVND